MKTLLIFLLFFGTSLCLPKKNSERKHSENDDVIKELWENSDFKELITYDLFKIAMTGYFQVQTKKKDVLTIVDLSKPSDEKRFYVIDLRHKKLLYLTYTAHGMNTGGNRAVRFSNKENSKMSSLGYFLTAETYIGKHGYSLKLDGIEPNINDHARKRAIVIHAADYVSEDFIRKHGRSGRSWGCPALPKALSKEIIDTISGGTCLFIFGDDDDYFKNSSFFEKNN